MRVVEAVAGASRRDGCVLAGQHQIVKRALRPGELAVGREGPGDVAGIAVEFAARVDQHQLAGAHRRGIGAVMQHAGVGTGRDDRAVGRVLRAALPEFMQQFGVEVVFADVLALAQHPGARLHRANVGAGADLRRAAHDVLLEVVLDEPHFVERPAEIAQLLRAHGAGPHAAPDGGKPSVHAGF